MKDGIAPGKDEKFALRALSLRGRLKGRPNCR
jgi:hypothetical protein